MEAVAELERKIKDGLEKAAETIIDVKEVVF
jgi:hypothetical protein